MRQLDLGLDDAAAPIQASAPAPTAPRTLVLVADRAPAEAPTPPFTAQLGAWLSARLRKPVRVVLTRNRSTMLSFREQGGITTLRLQQIFLHAGAREHEAIARYMLDGDRDASRVIDAFVVGAGALAAPRSRSVRSRGRFFDLDELFDELNGQFFHGACAARIGWGSAGTKRYRRTIQLGCYVSTEDLIRMHPCLDQAFVPRDYVRWIIFHEMLHEVLGTEQKAGRRCVHPPEFVALEQTFPNWERCKQWERDNIHRLLRYRPPSR